MFDGPEVKEPGDKLLIPIGNTDDMSHSLHHLLPSFMAGVLESAHERQLPAGNVVMARFILAEPDSDTLPLLRLVYKVFEGGIEPETVEAPHDDALCRIWVRAKKPASKKTPTLLSGDALQWRAFENRSFAIFAPVRAFWPPPLVIGPQITDSLLWSFKVSDPAKERAILSAMGDRLDVVYIGFFFAVVRPTGFSFHDLL
jgi:hypothetical protein